jgi:hypothetical protein
MIVAEACPVCDSRRLVRRPAMVSPFAAERIWQSAPFPCHLLKCRDCGFVFFDLRPDESEMGRLYVGYRGPEYQQQRQRYEPEYNPDINRAIGGDREIEVRKLNLSRFLAGQVDAATVGSVLDFGGDKGQFIPDEFGGAARYVYDMSGVDTVDGVVGLASLDGLAPGGVDFVMCSHVLEHVSAPRDLLREVTGVAGADTLIYLEVPLDPPVEFPFPRTDLPPLTRVRMTLRSNPVLLAAYQGIRGLKVSPTMMHEHINFFSEASLQELLDREGLVVRRFDTNVLDVGWSNVRVLSCLASPAGADSERYCGRR